jgi:hypothetical protein
MKMSTMVVLMLLLTLETKTRNPVATEKTETLLKFLSRRVAPVAQRKFRVVFHSSSSSLLPS